MLERAERKPILIRTSDLRRWPGENSERDAMVGKGKIELQQGPAARSARQARQNPHPLPTNLGLLEEDMISQLRETVVFR